MRFLLLLPLAMLGCSPFEAIEVMPGIKVQAENEFAFNPHHVAVAITLLADAWPGRFEYPTESSPLVVRMQDESEMPALVGYTQVMGATYHAGDVRIVTDAEHNMASRTALTHELIHATLFRTTGDGDRDHAEEVLGHTWKEAHTNAGVQVDAQLEVLGW